MGDLTPLSLPQLMSANNVMDCTDYDMQYYWTGNGHVESNYVSCISNVGYYKI